MSDLEYSFFFVPWQGSLLSFSHGGPACRGVGLAGGGVATPAESAGLNELICLLPLAAAGSPSPARGVGLLPWSQCSWLEQDKQASLEQIVLHTSDRAGHK